MLQWVENKVQNHDGKQKQIQDKIDKSKKVTEKKETKDTKT